MIISAQRRFIFVHSPKTGGTALAAALEGRAARDDILIGDTPKAQRRKGRLKGLHPVGRLWKHSTLADIEGVVARADFGRFFVLTLVRNPWDRVVSYYHWLRMQGFDHSAVRIAKDTDFGGFLAHPQTQISLRAHPYGSYVRDGAGLEHCQLFARLEHLEADLAPFFAHLGFAVEVPVVNASKRDADWRGYYTDADAAIVADICAEDIARFDYRFDPEVN